MHARRLHEDARAFDAIFVAIELTDRGERLLHRYVLEVERKRSANARMQEHAVARTGDDRHEHLRRRGSVDREIETRLELGIETRHAELHGWQQRLVKHLLRRRRRRGALRRAGQLGADDGRDFSGRRTGAAIEQAGHEREGRGGAMLSLKATMLSPHLVLIFLFLRVRACGNTQFIALSYTSKHLLSMHFFLGTQARPDKLQKASALGRRPRSARCRQSHDLLKLERLHRDVQIGR